MALVVEVLELLKLLVENAVYHVESHGNELERVQLVGFAVVADVVEKRLFVGQVVVVVDVVVRLPALLADRPDGALAFPELLLQLLLVLRTLTQEHVVRHVHFVPDLFQTGLKLRCQHDLLLNLRGFAALIDLLAVDDPVLHLRPGKEHRLLFKLHPHQMGLLVLAYHDLPPPPFFERVFNNSEVVTLI